MEMYPLDILVPDHIRQRIDGLFEVRLREPCVLFLLEQTLQPTEMKDCRLPEMCERPEELCDKSMVTLFEDLGHSLYKSGRWSDMIKSHFRLKLGEGVLYPEVEQVLNEDVEQQVENLAKRIYKTSKQTLVDQLLRRSRKIPINAQRQPVP
ncbi:hypothetical protein [uncultured Selenomonas sp.]|uniref:hypothetical protein n=1 Tax=uncultured Selenomonas sp. TaxID=159275 RepID=UPI00258A94D9|nr:hypothetical protein [uncultured Selenomonas sp.]